MQKRKKSKSSNKWLVSPMPPSKVLPIIVQLPDPHYPIDGPVKVSYFRVQAS